MWKIDGVTAKRAALCLAASVGLAMVIIVASRLSASPPDASDAAINLVIPPGAAEAVARGENPVSIPAKLQFQPNATIRVVNNDSVPHQLAWLVIPPGEEHTASQSALFPKASRFLCSFHAGGTLSVSTPTGIPLSFDVLSTILLFALPLAAAAFGVITIVSRLDHELAT